MRQVALHLEVDALDELRKADERANGYVRNRPGGAGRRGELRRADLHVGVRQADGKRTDGPRKATRRGT